MTSSTTTDAFFGFPGITMRTATQIISLISFCAVSLPCWLFLAGSLDLETVQWLACLGTIGWFVATPIWMGRSAIVDGEPTI